MSRPPGFRTLQISEIPMEGVGQQWIAAPACTKSKVLLSNGSLPTSALTSIRLDPSASAAGEVPSSFVKKS